MQQEQLFLQINKTVQKTKNIKDEVLTSWILDAIRKVFGLEDIRKNVLKYFLPISLHTQIEFGKTFGSETKMTMLKKYLESSLTCKKRLLLFTVSNMAKNQETHYQTFVLDLRYKHLWVIDPASVMGQTGIYQPFIANDTIIPFYKNKGFTTEFVKLKNPCQSTENDVFCQTWSLFLQIEFVKKYLEINDMNIILSIPKALRHRYKYLIAFYKKSVRYVDSVCIDLSDIYNYEISTSKYLVEGLATQQDKMNLRNYYKSFDPCKELLKMNEIDLI